MSTAARYGWAALLLAVTTALAAAIQAVYPVPDLVVLYLLAVMIAAVKLGRGPAIATAASSVAAYDFFFVLPFHTFVVADMRYVLSFAMMFGVGYFLSELAEEARAAALRAEADAVRGSVLSAVSHDLRTPLGTIVGAASSLRDAKGLTSEAAADLAAVICEEGERMERLVANLLDMTRIESGAVVLRPEWVPLEELIGSVLSRLEERLGARTLDVRIPADLPLLHVDPLLFEQLFFNLIENAAKYTPDGSVIEVEARADGTSIQVEILDRGPGLLPGLEERVFDKFYRGNHAGVHGLGLGLAISRFVAEAHGGTVRARNRKEGGAVFCVRLPRSHPPPTADAMPAAPRAR